MNLLGDVLGSQRGFHRMGLILCSISVGVRVGEEICSECTGVVWDAGAKIDSGRDKDKDMS